MRVLPLVTTGAALAFIAHWAWGAEGSKRPSESPGPQPSGTRLGRPDNRTAAADVLLAFDPMGPQGTDNPQTPERVRGGQQTAAEAGGQTAQHLDRRGARHQHVGGKSHRGDKPRDLGDQAGLQVTEAYEGAAPRPKPSRRPDVVIGAGC